MFRQSLGALALVAALAVPFVASAQSVPAPQADPNAPAPAAGAPAPGGHHHHHRGGAYMRAMRNLNLSDAQKSKIKDIVQQARAANAATAAKAGAPVDPQTRRANMVALRQQIEGVLTDTQRAQLHATLKQQRQAHDAGGQAPAPPAQPQ